MEFNKLVIGTLMAGTLAAAGGGAYMAVRQNAAEQTVAAAPDAAAIPPESTRGAASAPGGLPVAESEGVIDPMPAAKPAAPAPVAAAPARTPAPARPKTQAAPPPTRARNTPAPSRPAPRAQAPAESSPAVAPAAQAPATTPSMWEARPSIEASAPERSAEPELPPAPPAPEILELVVPSDSVLGLQIERTLSSETARVEDRVEARVTRDIRVGNRVAIPAGSTVQGSVTEVDRGGKVRETAKLGVRFHTVVLADGSRLNIRTDSIIREGQSPAKESAAKIGGAAVGGAILGAILGGGRGAAIGGAVGAAGGTAAQMASGRNAAVLPAGTTVSVRIQQPVTVTVEKE